MINRLNPGNTNISGVNSPSVPVSAAKPAEMLSPSNTTDDMVSINLHLQDQVVEDPQPVGIHRSKLNEILNSERFIVSDGKGVGFTEEEKLAILGGKDSTFNAKLNVCVHTTGVVNFFEKQLGYKLQWPTEYFRHYLGEGDKVRKRLASGNLDEKKRERYLDFLKDMNRDVAIRDDKRVFLNIAPSDSASGPSFNAGKLQATFTPYPSSKNMVIMRPDKDPEAIGHETGHLVHASIRPGWDEAKYSFDADFETCAMREAFADSSALLYSLQHRHNCEEVLKETGGNLRMSNRSSRISEEGGGDILKGYFRDRGVPTKERYLRDLVNDYKYVERSDAPELVFGSPNVGQLYNNVYSYSQVMSGAVYDIMTGIFDKTSADSPDKAQCLADSADKTGKLLAKSLELAPWWKPDFKTLAKCMLITDQQENKGEHSEILKKVFMDRNILSDKDIKEALTEKDRLPELNLKDLPSSPENAAGKLISKGLLPRQEGVTYLPGKTYKNDKGETFVSILMEKPFEGDLSEVPFSMSVAIMGDICDLTPDMKERSSLVMKFDNDGKLTYSHREGWSKTDMAQNYLKLQEE